MAKQPRALRTAEETAKVPLDQPILVELPGADEDSSLASGEQEREVSRSPPPRAPKPSEDDPAKRMADEISALKATNESHAKTIERLSQERYQAIQAATQFHGDAEQARIREAQTEHDYLSNALAAAQNQLAGAKLAAKQAGESGNFEAQAEANDQIADARATIRDSERALATLERRAQPQAQAPQISQNQPTAPPQDVNASIESNTNLLPAEKAFLKQHPELVLDAALNNELSVAHNRALRQGIRRGSDSYFKFVNEFMGYSAPEAQGQEDAEVSDNAPVSAPVSRQSAAPGSSPNRVQLTSEQREIARSMGLSDIEYAGQVIKLREDKQAQPEKYATRG